MIPVSAQYRLGVSKPSPQDRRLLKAGKYFQGLPPPPSSWDWQKSPIIQMALNNDIGDCTIATAVHLLGDWTYNALANQFMVSDPDIIKAYSAVSGYDPVTGRNDNGAMPVDVLKLWRNTGIAGKKIIAWVALDILDHTQVMQAIWTFGGIYTAVWLPISAQAQIGKLWEVDNTANGRVGSWGGHAVGATKYDKDELLVPTWGAKQRLTWRFWDKYYDEAYAIVTPDWLKQDKISPSGFDLNQLLKDLDDINSKDPTPVPDPVPPSPVPPNNGCVPLSDLVAWARKEKNIAHRELYAFIDKYK